MKTKTKTNVTPYAWAGISKTKRRDIFLNISVYKSIYDRYKRGKMVYNKYVDKQTIGFDYSERKMKDIKNNINLYLEQILKFCTIYKLGDLTKYDDVTSKSRKKHISEVRRLFIDACFNQINVDVSTILLGKFLKRDHATIIHNRRLQEDFKIMYKYERLQSDYILSFANQSIIDVINFTFDEESTNSIKSGAWGK